jgi:GxxExxY protein
MTDQYHDLTEQIIGCAYRVSNTLGCGFLEKVYENALVYELKELGLGVEQQQSIEVIYAGIIAGHYVADLIVDRKVIIEMKAVTTLNEIHAAQTLNYLKATGLPVALLLNFGKPKIEIRRFLNRF